MTVAGFDADVVVIGAGVVGLAIARAFAIVGRNVIILERAARFGEGISSRNSEVVHAGLYYPAGSLKASFCASGRDLLYEHCRRTGVPMRTCGKLIVASDASEIASLYRLAETAAANGVKLERLTGREAQTLEPELKVTAALLSPRTAIVDSHGFMMSLLAEAEAHGAMLVAHSSVKRLEKLGGGLAAITHDGTILRARTIINAAGLDAAEIGKTILQPHLVPATYYAKGSYFSYAGAAPFARLIYPLPNAAGLGVHATIDLSGRVKFGPDVEWVERPDYTVDPTRAEAFYAAIRRYWPGLQDGRLQPDYAGVRPKLVGAGSAAADFRIDGPVEHGVAGLVNLYGIESPGLTASLAIGAHVAAMPGL